MGVQQSCAHSRVTGMRARLSRCPQLHLGKGMDWYPPPRSRFAGVKLLPTQILAGRWDGRASRRPPAPSRRAEAEDVRGSARHSPAQPRHFTEPAAGTLRWNLVASDIGPRFAPDPCGRQTRRSPGQHVHPDVSPHGERRSSTSAASRQGGWRAARGAFRAIVRLYSMLTRQVTAQMAIDGSLLTGSGKCLLLRRSF